MRRLGNRGVKCRLVKITVDKPRPVKMILSRPLIVNQILSKARKLKDSDKHNSVLLSTDRFLEQGTENLTRT